MDAAISRNVLLLTSKLAPIFPSSSDNILSLNVHNELYNTQSERQRHS